MAGRRDDDDATRTGKPRLDEALGFDPLDEAEVEPEPTRIPIGESRTGLGLQRPVTGEQRRPTVRGNVSTLPPYGQLRPDAQVAQTGPRVVVDSGLFRELDAPAFERDPTDPDLRVNPKTAPEQVAVPRPASPASPSSMDEAQPHVRSALLRRRTAQSAVAKNIQRAQTAEHALPSLPPKSLPPPPPLSRPQPRPVVRSGLEVKQLGKAALPPPLPSNRSLLKPVQREPTDALAATSLPTETHRIPALPVDQVDQVAQTDLHRVPALPADQSARTDTHRALDHSEMRTETRRAPTFDPPEPAPAPPPARGPSESSGLLRMPIGTAKAMERAKRVPTDPSIRSTADALAQQLTSTASTSIPTALQQEISRPAMVTTPVAHHKTATVTFAREPSQVLAPERRIRLFAGLSLATLALLFEALALPTTDGAPWELVLRPTEVGFMALASFLLVLVVHLLPVAPRTRGVLATLVGLVLVVVSLTAFNGTVRRSFDAQPALVGLFETQPLVGIALTVALVALLTACFLRRLAPRHLASTALFGFGAAIGIAVVVGMSGAFGDPPVVALASSIGAAPFVGDRVAAVACMPALLALLGTLALTWPGLAARAAAVLGVVLWLLVLAPIVVLALFVAHASDWIAVLGPLKLATLAGASVLYLAAGLARALAPREA